MRRHQGHIRQRSADSFELRYSIGTDPVTRKWRVKTSTFKGSRKEAERELRNICDHFERQGYIEPSKVTVREYLHQWLASMHSQVTIKTHEGYTDIIRRYLIPALGNLPLTKLTPAHIQNAYNGWEKGGRNDGKAGGLSARSRLFIHRVLKSALSHALRLELITRNPADAVKAPRIKKIHLATLTVEQSVKLLDALRNKWLYWPVLLSLSTGMRRGEILALRWRNVDFAKKAIQVVESLEQSRQGLRFKAPKNERTRAVILPEHAVDDLRYLKEKQAKELADVNVNQTEATLVCARYDGEPMLPLTVTHEFGKAVQKIPQLPKIRFHDLRHSHATQLLSAGIHPKIAQERLGHSTITTTLDIYSHASDTMQSEAATKLDDAFRTATRRAKPNFHPG